MAGRSGAGACGRAGRTMLGVCKEPQVALQRHATGCMLLIPSNKARSLTAVPNRALAASSPLYAAAWLDGRRSSTLQRRAAMELSRIAGRGGEDAVVVLAVSWWRRISRWPVGGADPRGGARWATAYLWGMPLPIAY